MKVLRIQRAKNVLAILVITTVLILILVKVWEEQSLSWIKNIPDDVTKNNLANNEQRPIPVNQEAKCYKINKDDSYQICDKAPYTSTDCGRNPESTEKYLVPNVVHFVWIGNRTLQIYDYLALRGAAANQKPDLIKFHYADNEPQGDLWVRAKQEIPCLKLIKFEPALTFQGNKVDTVIHQTDIRRAQILQEEGGIYVDSDAMILRSMDPLRKFEFTMGRTFDAFNSGVIISQPNSSFLLKWIELYKTYTKDDYFITLSYRLHQSRPDLPIHIEEISLQRPKPWFDGHGCFHKDSFDISEHYVLHVHPNEVGEATYTSITEEGIRQHDTTYGAAARATLFGTQDLIFLTSEASKAHNRTKQKAIKRYQPIQLKRVNLPGL